MKHTQMKNSYLYMLGVAVMATSLTACKDDDLVKGTPLEEGAEIQFGVAPKADGTRTYYDPTDVSNADATAWDIFWNYGENNKDHIYVYSPEAAAGRNQAEYVVNATEGGQNTTIACIKTGDYGVQAGAKNPHNFYAAYPASNVKQGQCTGTQIKMTMPGRQNARFVGFDDEETNIIPSKPSTTIQTYKTAPDMSCALMVAENKDVTLEEGKSVDLPFKSLANCLDITITGGKSNSLPSERITSVIIEAYQDDAGTLPAYISGDFTYDFTDKSVTYDSNASNSVMVSIKDMDQDGDNVGIPLWDGQTINVKAFVVPSANIGMLKVNVYTEQSRHYEKKLNIAHFERGQINKVVLPKTDPERAIADYSVWLSQLDPRIYISELSLPGSALAFNYVLKDNEPVNSTNVLKPNTYQKQYKTQTIDFRQQLMKGSRILQAHVTVKDNTDTTPYMATSSGEAQTQYSLDYVIKQVAAELNENHGDEFCVLVISDWCTEANIRVPHLYEGIQAVIEANKDIIAQNISANTTIADVKGKVILKIAPNEDFKDSWSYFNNQPIWMNVFNKNAQTGILYSSMTYGKTTGLESSTSALNSNWPMAYIYSEEANPCGDEGTSINSTVTTNVGNMPKAFANNYTSAKHNVFGMTYLGGTGNSKKTGDYNLWTNNWSYTVKTFTPTQVVESLLTTWKSAVSKIDFTQKPYGWVLLNMIGANENVNNAVTEIIDHNTTDWKLARDRTQSATALNDATSKNRGPLFVKRRR